MGEFAGADPFYRRFVEKLQHSWRIMAPVTAADGVCRLQAVTDVEDRPCALPFLSLKKIVLPSSDLLWTCREGEYHLPPNPTFPAGVALINVAPCDLYALAYLDQAFADDPFYTARRQRLLLVGAECSPTDLSLIHI